ncbi:hypothetical protein [Streptomyces griseoaurantiacus]|uniref:Uncharacterized protein n=1 Tax=Streptomyces griseoaurantiacus M045 TaxID=996637 RepID=F3NTC3_9ACTN|nr:hypothetical protein [Streptomyces griseoaurantiacus]EGG43476.1 hypothetical protein SGM_6616 [Streptomyces griseoaurantiacus M045]WTI25432.1 hypothetical protein OHA67_03300 [Streptomyces jietaisiensis]
MPMSNAQQPSFSGHCGHQHVPSGNNHGDPGPFPMLAILSAASGGLLAPEVLTGEKRKPPHFKGSSASMTA